jgi:hypothetical protein
MRKSSSISLDKKQKALMLRSLGLSARATSDYLDISVRSVQRLWCGSGIPKGELGGELIAKCREELFSEVLGEVGLKNAIVAFLIDEAAHTRHLRDKMAKVFDEFDPKTDGERAVFMRASAAYSTALKNTSDITRKALDVETFRESSNIEALPELVVKMMTEEDELRLREGQRLLTAELNGLPTEGV